MAIRSTHAAGPLRPAWRFATSVQPIACAGALAAAAACTQPPSQGTRPQDASASRPMPDASAQAPDAVGVSSAVASAPAPEPPGPKQIDPDGNDDPEDSGTGELPTEAHFERVGRSRLALQRICDLTPFADALYAAHAYQPLGTDGATITKYRPEDPNGGFTTAFDWNRPGERTTGGGAGQGFIRVHTIGARLFVPDADPPYNGLGLVEHGTEGYVFVSDSQGVFAPARNPGHLPPLAPDPNGKAGAAVLPRAYHVIDVIRFRGRLISSTGSVPPKERAWYGPSPGALHVANEDWSRWLYEVDYPYPWKDGVWRLTFMVRFKDRLYAGIQDYDGREPNDYVVFDPPPDAKTIERSHVHAMRVTPTGTAQTLRWIADEGKLYWIAMGRDGVQLRVTDDGEHWKVVDLPALAGSPSDVARFRGALVVMAERGLYKLTEAGAVLISQVPDKKTPFVVNDIFCAPPLAVFRNELYAGGQRDGALYKLVDGPAPATK